MIALLRHNPVLPSIQGGWVQFDNAISPGGLFLPGDWWHWSGTLYDPQYMHNPWDGARIVTSGNQLEQLTIVQSRKGQFHFFRTGSKQNDQALCGNAPKGGHMVGRLFQDYPQIVHIHERAFCEHCKTAWRKMVAGPHDVLAKGICRYVMTAPGMVYTVAEEREGATRTTAKNTSMQVIHAAAEPCTLCDKQMAVDHDQKDS